MKGLNYQPAYFQICLSAHRDNASMLCDKSGQPPHFTLGDPKVAVLKARLKMTWVPTEQPRLSFYRGKKERQPAAV